MLYCTSNVTMNCMKVMLQHIGCMPSTDGTPAVTCQSRRRSRLHHALPVLRSSRRCSIWWLSLPSCVKDGLTHFFLQSRYVWKKSTHCLISAPRFDIGIARQFVCQEGNKDPPPVGYNAFSPGSRTKPGLPLDMDRRTGKSARCQFGEEAS